MSGNEENERGMEDKVMAKGRKMTDNDINRRKRKTGEREKNQQTILLLD